MIAQREMAVKTIAADEALWAVRRGISVERPPKPSPAWRPSTSKACRARSRPRCSASGLGPRHASAGNVASRTRSATRRDRVVAPSSPVMPGRGEYVVVTALGMGPAWKVGTVVGERRRCGARAPLR